MRIGVLSAGNIDRYQSQSALHYIKSGTGGSKERYTGGKKNNCMCCNAETEREREKTTCWEKGSRHSGGVYPAVIESSAMGTA